MLDTQDKVVRLLKAAMLELNLREKGRVEFGPNGFDFAGMVDVGEYNVAPELALRWKLDLFYPSDSEKSKVYNFQINTMDFDSEDAIKAFLIQEIRRQMD